MFPGVSFVATSIPGLAAAASLAGSSGAIVTVGQAGGFFLGNDSSGVAVAVSPPPVPLLPLSVAQQLTLGFSGQVSIAWSVVGGNILAVDGGATTTAAFLNPVFIAIRPSDAAIRQLRRLPPRLPSRSGWLRSSPRHRTASSESPAVARAPLRPGSIRTTGVSYLKSARKSLASFGPNQAFGESGRVLPVASTPSLARSMFAALVAGREADEWGNPEDVDITALRSMGEAAGQLGLMSLTPQRLGLIVDFRPFDPIAVQQRIDQFLDQLDRLGAGLSSIHESMDIGTELLALALALAAWNLVPKILRRSSGAIGPATCDDATSLDGITGLPGGTSVEEP